jgi:hypothetical protein
VPTNRQINPERWARFALPTLLKTPDQAAAAISTLRMRTSEK